MVQTSGSISFVSSSARAACLQGSSSLLQDFKSFFSPLRNYRVAAYVYISFLSSFAVLPRFKGVNDILALDVSSQEPLFRTSFHFFWLINAYSTNTGDHQVHSVSPKTLFPTLGVPFPVLGYLNLHNPLSDLSRSFPPR